MDREKRESRKEKAKSKVLVLAGMFIAYDTLEKLRVGEAGPHQEVLLGVLVDLKALVYADGRVAAKEAGYRREFRHLIQSMTEKPKQKPFVKEGP